MMKRWSIALSAAALIGAGSLISGTPVLAELQKAGENIVQAIRQPKVKLQLTAAKKITNAQGNMQWQNLADNAVVMPGDTLRYTVSSNNLGEAKAKNFAITQSISKQMTYKSGSAQSNQTAEVVYSIDGGKNYSAKPIIKITMQDGKVKEQPAPAKAYTHIRFKFKESLDPKAEVKAMYEVEVR